MYQTVVVASQVLFTHLRMGVTQRDITTNADAGWGLSIKQSVEKFV